MRIELDCTVKSGKPAGNYPGRREPDQPLRAAGADTAGTEIRRPGKNILIPSGIFFMMSAQVPGKEVISVNRPLFFTPLKS
jgi:hypothetical protein